jgi:hypothetical protein
MRNVLLSFFTFLVITNSTFGQISKVDSFYTIYDEMYGLDMLLHNGKKYFTDIYSVEGHPFWKGQDELFADLYLQGKIFKNKQLRYNLNAQEFILSYSSSKGEHYPIILTNSLIDSVRAEGIVFIKNMHPEISQSFIQPIYEGNISCFVGWYKDIVFKKSGGRTRSTFSDERKDNYLLIENEIHKFNNKGNFLKIFPKKERKTVRKYWTNNELKLKIIKDEKFRQLIIFCESILK